jgi:hypothetical protein
MFFLKRKSHHIFPLYCVKKNAVHFTVCVGRCQLVRGCRRNLHGQEKFRPSANHITIPFSTVSFPPAETHSFHGQKVYQVNLFKIIDIVPLHQPAY